MGLEIKQHERLELKVNYFSKFIFIKKKILESTVRVLKLMRLEIYGAFFKKTSNEYVVQKNNLQLNKEFDESDSKSTS